jgi:iron donor protein CyaY
MDDREFQHRAETSIETLKSSLMAAEDDVDMEVEEQGGAIHISFETPPGHFVISPNSAARQIWISALATSFKLDWSEPQNDWVLGKTGEALKPLVARLIGDQTGEAVTL